MNHIDGLDVINVGLVAVLYDTDLHKYYTPNTGTIGDLENNTTNDVANEDKMLENHELAEAYDESGNSAERDGKECEQREDNERS